MSKWAVSKDTRYITIKVSQQINERFNKIDLSRIISSYNV